MFIIFIGYTNIWNTWKYYSIWGGRMKHNYVSKNNDSTFRWRASILRCCCICLKIWEWWIRFLYVSLKIYPKSTEPLVITWVSRCGIQSFGNWLRKRDTVSEVPKTPWELFNIYFPKINLHPEGPPLWRRDIRWQAPTP